MEAILEAKARETLGKNEARRTRRDGRVPAVLYGKGRDALPIAVDPKALLKILHSDSGANTLISLQLAGAADMRVLVKEFQLDPVTRRLRNQVRCAQRTRHRDRRNAGNAGHIADPGPAGMTRTL